MAYRIVKKSDAKSIKKEEFEKINGFVFTPLNSVKYDGIVVTNLTLIKPSFVEKLLKKKIKRKLDAYLKFIISIIDDNNDDSSDDDVTRISQVLDDIARYKSIVDSKYRSYLDEKYISLLKQKILILEVELKDKLRYKKDFKQEVDEYTRGRSR